MVDVLAKGSMSDIVLVLDFVLEWEFVSMMEWVFVQSLVSE